MARGLKLSIGQHSDKGAKEVNQDFHGALVPDLPTLKLKGISIALAEWNSSAACEQHRRRNRDQELFNDYYCTSDSWSVKTAAQRVIAATNSWLHAQTRRSQHRYDIDKGYVCTLSAMVVKSATAHIFHIGDCRIYRIVGKSLEQLTEDHRLVVSSQETYLGRALGMKSEVEIDYRAVPLELGDTFLLATDGVYGHVAQRFHD